MPYSDQVDAEPARRHVQALVDAGMSIVQIQNLSGVNRTSIRVLLGLEPRRVPSAEIRAGTASRLLRTRLDRGSSIDGLVPAAGTLRRLHALHALGYPGRYLAQRLGNAPTTMAVHVARRDLVRADTAMRVEELYRELGDTVGPSARTREHARHRGWLPPIWWDDDQMDDPLYEPEGARDFDSRGRLVDNVMLPRAHRVALMTRYGLTDDEIAARIGTLVRYVKRDRLERPMHVEAVKIAPAAPVLDEVAVARFMAGQATTRTGYRVSPEQLEAIRRLAATGANDQQIGARVDLTRDAVLKLRQRNGIAAGAPIERTA